MHVTADHLVLNVIHFQVPLFLAQGSIGLRAKTASTFRPIPFPWSPWVASFSSLASWPSMADLRYWHSQIENTDATFCTQGTISSVGDGERLGRSVMASLVACGSGGITVLFLNKFFGTKTWSLAKIVNGCLSGMVSIAGACDHYTPWMAFVIAAVAGSLHLVVSHVMVKLKIDDPVDACAVHLGSGTTLKRKKRASKQRRHSTFSVLSS